MFHIRSSDLTHLMTELYPCTKPSLFPSIPQPLTITFLLFVFMCLLFFFFFLSLQNRWHSIYLSLEKEMIIHSSLLAWEISWRKKPGELQSMILQNVGLNLGSKPPPPSFIFYIWLMVSKFVHSAYIHLPFFYQTISHFKSPTFLLSRPVH